MSTGPTAITACAMVLTVTAGCSVNGPTYPEVIGHETAPAPEQVRIVFLRPDDRYDDYSGSEAVIRVNDGKLGELGYGGFLYTDVPAGAASIEAGTSNPLRLPWVKSCRFQLELNAGSTVFFDVRPRPSSVAIGVLSAIVGFGLIGAGPTTYGVGEVGEMFVDEMAQSAQGPQPHKLHRQRSLRARSAADLSSLRTSTGSWRCKNWKAFPGRADRGRSRKPLLQVVRFELRAPRPHLACDHELAVAPVMDRARLPQGSDMRLDDAPDEYTVGLDDNVVMQPAFEAGITFVDQRSRDLVRRPWREPEILDLVVIAAVRVPYGNDRIEKLYGWDIDHAFAGCAYQTIAPVLIPYVAGEQRGFELQHHVPAHGHDIDFVASFGGHEDDRPGLEMLPDLVQRIVLLASVGHKTIVHMLQAACDQRNFVQLLCGFILFL